MGNSSAIHIYRTLRRYRSVLVLYSIQVIRQFPVPKFNIFKE
ncbi:hypothetical protein OMO38_16490 [Chryseobacterium sp. 09-1422]|uniref:Uncharacterized protein n=1 Tax=Chryseobacterium kimseyorum TaxID=2984028 RepID=A0ABT3I247_9FLAO|nr:hypothetical protein [Chryseobacterium kimseyorum]MCW3170126.1 hypothetical protein [Chryseobacterium kimseyorum]